APPPPPPPPLPGAGPPLTVSPSPAFPSPAVGLWGRGRCALPSASRGRRGCGLRLPRLPPSSSPRPRRRRLGKGAGGGERPGAAPGHRGAGAGEGRAPRPRPRPKLGWAGLGWAGLGWAGGSGRARSPRGAERGGGGRSRSPSVPVGPRRSPSAGPCARPVRRRSGRRVGPGPDPGFLPRDSRTPRTGTGRSGRRNLIPADPRPPARSPRRPPARSPGAPADPRPGAPADPRPGAPADPRPGAPEPPQTPEPGPGSSEPPQSPQTLGLREPVLGGPPAPGPGSSEPRRPPPADPPPRAGAPEAAGMRRATARTSLFFTCCCLLLMPVNGIHPECRFHLEIHEEEIQCMKLLNDQKVEYKACSGVWDNLTCWRPADIGETVTVPCPKVFSNFYSFKTGTISKNCTSDGWSEMFPDFINACGYTDSDDDDIKITFYILVKAIYTLGYSVSLIALTTGSIILCLFRKLHCTRNYIHLNLFLSFILRAISVLVKDDILYSSSGTLHCLDQPSSWESLQYSSLCGP
uniref:Vasoactive intestinal peptide receptor 2 n=1 Tax=Ornithorhynchus anatinus TaxID=9258 RepID=A0A6I8PF34_ORNAN